MRSKWALTAMLCLGLAAATVRAEDWREASSFSCAGESSLVCDFAKNVTGISARVVVQNEQRDKPITFTWEEHHSACGSPGSNVHSESISLGKGGSASIRLLDPGLSVTCRIVTLRDCSQEGDTPNDPKTAVDCAKVLSAMGKTYIGNRQ